MKNTEKWKKTFIKIWFGQSFSLVTSSIVQYAIIWYITYQTKSAFYLSLATLLGFVPQGILGLFIGSYIDRKDRKQIMIISDLFIAIISLIMVVYGVFITIPIWLILICLGLRSVGTAFHSPSLQASIPLIVPEEQLLKYSGYSQSMQSLSLIISPAIAALLYGKIDIAFIILLDVVGVFVALFTLIISEIPRLKDYKQEKTSFCKEVVDGFKMIVNNKIIKYIFIISALYMFLYMPISSLFPLMTISYFEKTSFYAGVVEMLFALGMLFGGLVLSKSSLFKNKKSNITISIFLMSISVLLSGLLLKKMFYLFILLSMIMGFSGPIIQATISTIFAEHVSQEYLGRIYSNYMSLTVMVMPLGLLLSGSFVDIIGINIWFLITGILLFILGIFVFVNKMSLDINK